MLDRQCRQMSVMNEARPDAGLVAFRPRRPELPAALH